MKSCYVMLSAFAIASHVAVAQGPGILWSSFNAGYEVSTSSAFTLRAVVGQTLVGTMHSPTTVLLSGFLVDTLFRSPATSLVEQDIAPLQYALLQNYPNPFNPTTTIRYALPNRSAVAIAVYNTLGQHVMVLQSSEQEAGYHEVQFDARRLSSGVYYYRMQTADYVQTRKMILMK